MTELTKHYFTFCLGGMHQYGGGQFTMIEAENPRQAREIMMRKFGKDWAFQYDETRWFNKSGISQQEEYGLKEVKG